MGEGPRMFDDLKNIFEIPLREKDGKRVKQLIQYIARVSAPRGGKVPLDDIVVLAGLQGKKEGIRINVVAPAAIETEMYDRFTGGDAKAKEQFASYHPIGRVGKPSEIASAVLWLGSEEASFMVGHTLTVDGGFTAQ